jgi:hypothetical protein
VLVDEDFILCLRRMTNQTPAPARRMQTPLMTLMTMALLLSLLVGMVMMSG